VVYSVAHDYEEALYQVYAPFPLPCCHLFTEFRENQFSSFCVILLINKLTNLDENITSLAEYYNNNNTTLF